MVEENQSNEKRIYFIKVAVFVVLAVALSLVCVGGALLDLQCRTEFIAVLLKIVIIAGIFVYAWYKKELRLLWENRYFTGFLLWAFMPCMIFSLSVIGTPDSFSSASLIILTILNVLTTAIWEELFFRYIGKSLFAKDDRFTISDFIVLTIVFAAVHLINMLFHPPLDVLLQAALAVTTGIFWLALYCKTKNIIVSITSHFAANLVAGLIPLFVSNPFLAGWGDLVVVAVMLACLSSGLWILIKYGFIKKRRGN